MSEGRGFRDGILVSKAKKLPAAGDTSPPELPLELPLAPAPRGRQPGDCCGTCECWVASGIALETYSDARDENGDRVFLGKQAVGRCHRYPPNAAMDQLVHGSAALVVMAFPGTRANTHCYEYRPATPAVVSEPPSPG